MKPTPPVTQERITTFRFGWEDGYKSWLRIRVDAANNATVVWVEGARARLPNLDCYHLFRPMRAEAELFAAMHHCRLTIENP